MKDEFDPDPRALKRRFKQRCVETGDVYRNWQIRVHRSLSWSVRAGAFGEEHPEAEVLFHWIALNSLYGEWDTGGARPAMDSGARSRFLRRAVGVAPGPCATHLYRHKPLIKKLLGSPFLAAAFWRNPDAPKAREHAVRDLYRLDGLLQRGPHATLYEMVFERVSVLRGQLVHGASSGGSKLNRGTLMGCRDWLRGAVPLLQHVAIELLADDGWPELCYPPVEG